MCINSGSDNEQICAIPLEKKLIRMLEGKKFIYCAYNGIEKLDNKNALFKVYNEV